MRSFAVCELERHSWNELRGASGSAERIPDALRELLEAPSPETAQEAYWRLENYVVIQGQLFESAEYVVPVLLAALLDDSPQYVRITVLELLFQIASGEAHQEEVDAGNCSLGDKCRARMSEGLWLLYREWAFGAREAAQEVIQAIETDPYRLEAFAQCHITR